MNSSSRNGAKVIWLAVHTTEGIMRAVDLRAWAAWPGSSHAASDETGVLLTPAEGFVPYDRAAWTLRNGNPISENIEQCGWARWTRAEWLARPLLLNATARWLADRSKARGIPLVHLSLADIKARRAGVIGHGDYTAATGDGTHTDPGPNYPWDVVLAAANDYLTGDDMPTADEIAAAIVNRPIDGMTPLWQVLRDLHSRDPQTNPVAQAVVDRKVVGDLSLWQWAQQQAAANASLSGQVAGLQAALSAVAQAPASTVDLNAVFKAAQDGARSIVDNLEVVARPDNAA